MRSRVWQGALQRAPFLFLLAVILGLGAAPLRPGWAQGAGIEPVIVPMRPDAGSDPVGGVAVSNAAARLALSLPPAIIEPSHGNDGRPAPSPCTQAAFVAELESGVPLGLLLAIGRIESGRPDPLHGHVAPWPWTTNVAGVGRFFENKLDAIAYLRDQQRQGVQSMDVGCFQVNLMYHPDAFATLEDAFDPLTNARYAAAFLTQLKARAGSWEAAVGLYHSATPSEGGWYRDRVLATWTGGDITIPAAQRPAFAARPRLSDPGVMIMSSEAFGMKVWTPGATAAGRGGLSARLVQAARH